MIQLNPVDFLTNEQLEEIRKKIDEAIKLIDVKLIATKFTDEIAEELKLNRSFIVDTITDEIDLEPSIKIISTYLETHLLKKLK